MISLPFAQLRWRQLGAEQPAAWPLGRWPGITKLLQRQLQLLPILLGRAGPRQGYQSLAPVGIIEGQQQKRLQ